jgi:hypothetical protein
MFLAKRTVLSLVLAAVIAPVVQAAGASPGSSLLPILTVADTRSALPAEPAARKLAVTGPTLGDVRKPVVLPSAPKQETATPSPGASLTPAPAESGVVTGILSVKPLPPPVVAERVKPAPRKSAKDSTSKKSPVIDGAAVEKKSYYDSVQVIPVSDRDYNRIVFPEPIVAGRMPAGTKLGEEIVYLSGNRAMMFQFASGQSKVIQLVVELASGRVETLYLKPQAIPGAIHRVDGAGDANPSPKKGASKSC